MIAVALLVLQPAVAHPADLGAGIADQQAVPASLLERTATRFALLMLVRAHFEVADASAVPGELVRRLGLWRDPDQLVADAARIDRALVAEGSYFITSVAYTIRAGGAIFPEGSDDTVLAAETLAELDALRDELLAGVSAGDDVTAVLRRTLEIWVLTGGTPTEGPNPFAGVAALVERALSAQGGTATWL